MNATVAFTLPISCQICLGKVKEPVSCDNNHVFCRACIVIWTSKNEHCPACRIPITTEKPFRKLIGGQNLQNEEKTGFSQPMIRKARVKALFSSYEEEIQRLNDKILIIEDENSKLISQIAPTADKPGLEKDDSNKNDSLSEADKETLNLLNAKLSEATQLYQKVSKDILKYQQENAELRQANIDLTRENDRMRYDLTQKTPSKVGRFTVAALESQIDKQKKEIESLHKALSLSDNHIEKLQSQVKLNTAQQPSGKLDQQQSVSHAAACNPPSSNKDVSHTSADSRQQNIPSSTDNGSKNMTSVTRVLFDRPTSAPALSLADRPTSAPALSLADIQARAARQAMKAGVKFENDNGSREMGLNCTEQRDHSKTGSASLREFNTQHDDRNQRKYFVKNNDADSNTHNAQKLGNDSHGVRAAHSLVDQNLTAVETMFEKPSNSILKQPNKPVGQWGNSPVTQLLGSAPPTCDLETGPTTPTKRRRYADDTTLHLDVPSLPSTPSTSRPMSSLCLTQQEGTTLLEQSDILTRRDNSQSMQRFTQSNRSIFESNPYVASTLPSKAISSIKQNISRSNLQSTTSSTSSDVTHPQSTYHLPQTNASTSRDSQSTHHVLRSYEYDSTATSFEGRTNVTADNSIFDEVEAQDLTMTSDFTDCLKILQAAERNVRDRSSPSN